MEPKNGGESGSGICMEASCAGSFSSSKAAALEKQLATTKSVDSEQMKALSKENERVRRCEAELQETARIFGDKILVASLCCLLYIYNSWSGNDMLTWKDPYTFLS